MNVPGVRNTNDTITKRQSDAQQQVGNDGAGVGKTEQRVIGEDGTNAEHTGMNQRFESKCRKGRVAVHDVDSFAQQDLTKQRKRVQNGRQYALVVNDHERQVVYFESVRHVPDAGAVIVRVSDYNHFVTGRDQTLR